MIMNGCGQNLVAQVNLKLLKDNKPLIHVFRVHLEDPDDARVTFLASGTNRLVRADTTAQKKTRKTTQLPPTTPKEIPATG